MKILLFFYSDTIHHRSKYKPGGLGANGEQVIDVDIFSIYFFLNFFIFPLLPGREKIRYHSITTCIIQHWRALPVAPFANTIIRSQRRNLICVCPTGLHPPCCNYCLFLLCIFDLKLSQWEGRLCISHKTNFPMNAWCFKCFYNVV